MGKKQLYIALGAGLVLVLGGIAYLGMSGESGFEAGPPVLEENPGLTGTLTADGDRSFKVESDFEGNGTLASQNVAEEERGKVLLEYSSKAPSNFLIFTAPKNVANVTVDRVAEDLIVDDGLSGYVLGTYRPTEGGWNLYPNKNYLGAKLMPADALLRSCETYFVIKIADDHNNANGYGTNNGWDAEERSKIAFEPNFYNSINTGSTDCAAEDRVIKEDGWNMVSMDVAGPDAVLGYFSKYDEVKAVWDTTVINQIDRTVDPAMTRNANQMLYVPNENRLADYFNGNIKSASIFDAAATYDGGKQDLWVYVGSEVEIPVEENTPPEMTPNDVVVNINDVVNEAVETAKKASSLEPIEELMGMDVKIPSERIFDVADADGDVVSISQIDTNIFDLGLSADKIGVVGADLTYSDLNLNVGGGKATKRFGVGVEVTDGEGTATSEADVTYEWDNKCSAVSQSYAFHLQNSLKSMVYERYNDNGEDFDEAKEFVVSELEAAIAATGDSSKKAAYESIWASLKTYVMQLSFDEAYFKQPPYLPAECGGGFASCVDVAVCSVMIEAIPVETIPFGKLVEKEAFKEKVDSPSMEANFSNMPESTEQEEACQNGEKTYYDPSVDDEVSCPESSSASTESASSTEASSYQGGGFNASAPSNQVQPDGNMQTNEGYCESRNLASSDVEWVNDSTSRSSEVASAENGNELWDAELEVLVDLTSCAGVWEIEHIVASGATDVEVMQVGKIYEVDTQKVFVRDLVSGASTSTYAQVYMVLGSDDKVGVFFTLEDAKNNYNPISGYDDPEFTLGDGVFWMGESDMNGVSAKKR